MRPNMNQLRKLIPFAVLAASIGNTACKHGPDSHPVRMPSLTTAAPKPKAYKASHTNEQATSPEKQLVNNTANRLVETRLNGLPERIKVFSRAHKTTFHHKKTTADESPDGHAHEEIRTQAVIKRKSSPKVGYGFHVS